MTQKVKTSLSLSQDLKKKTRTHVRNTAQVSFILLSISWLVFTLTCWFFLQYYIPETTWSRFCPVDGRNSRNIYWSPAGLSSDPEQTDTLSHPSSFQVEGAFHRRPPGPGPAFVMKREEILQDAVEEAEGTHTHELWSVVDFLLQRSSSFRLTFKTSTSREAVLCSGEAFMSWTLKMKRKPKVRVISDDLMFSLLFSLSLSAAALLFWGFSLYQRVLWIFYT